MIPTTSSPFFPVTRPVLRVAFFGESRSGKDTAAIPLIALGYEPITRGNLIKSGVRGLKGRLGAFRLLARAFVCGASGKEMMRLYKSVSYYLAHKISPITEDETDKEAIRPLLEWYGKVHSARLLRTMMAYVPEKCVNTRIYEVEEARAWRGIGGKIIEITRKKSAYAPTISAFERERLAVIRREGLIDETIANDGSKNDLFWQVLSATATLQKERTKSP